MQMCFVLLFSVITNNNCYLHKKCCILTVEKHQKGGGIMATVSLHKDFEVKNKNTFEQFKKDAGKAAASDRSVKISPSLEKGIEKLKQFSFR